MSLPASGEAPGPLRSVRSFVRREGRMTEGQRRALESLWPVYGVADGRGPLDLDRMFGRRAPRHLEIGSGNGECVIELARRHPDNDYLAVEVHRPGVGHLLARLAALELANVRVAATDVCELLPRLPVESLSAVYVFFPDPWPKKRHHKRRLLKPEFLGLLAPRIARHACLFVATDCADYAAAIGSLIETLPGWCNLAGPGQRAPRLGRRPCTRFEARGRRSGAQIADFVLARAASHGSSSVSESTLGTSS